MLYAPSDAPKNARPKWLEFEQNSVENKERQSAAPLTADLMAKCAGTTANVARRVRVRHREMCVSNTAL